jgi:hypothetical protein
MNTRKNKKLKSFERLEKGFAAKTNPSRTLTSNRKTVQKRFQFKIFDLKFVLPKQQTLIPISTKIFLRSPDVN